MHKTEGAKLVQGSHYLASKAKIGVRYRVTGHMAITNASDSPLVQSLRRRDLPQLAVLKFKEFLQGKENAVDWPTSKGNQNCAVL